MRSRLLELARRAFDRRATVAFDAAGETTYGGATDEEIRRQLDPNENTRWTVGVAAVLLLGYAVMLPLMAWLSWALWMHLAARTRREKWPLNTSMRMCSSVRSV